LLFIRDDGALYAAPFSLGTHRVTGDAVQLAPRVVTKISGWADYDVADDGTIAYVAGSESRRRLMLVDRDGKSTPIGSEMRRFNFPRISPDGQRIAVEIGTGSGFDIWTYDQGSHTLSPFTTDRRSIRPSDWTTDGKRLVYIGIRADSANNRWGRWDIVISGETPREAPRGLVAGGAAVAAAQGSSFAYWSTDGIKVAPLETPANSRLLVPASEKPGIMRLSRDGRYLAYESALSGDLEIFAQQASGDGPRVQISSGGGEEPLWSPDGSEVIYRGGGSFIAAQVTRNPLRVVRRDTLFKDTYIRGAVTGNYDIMPNGRQFVAIKAENPDVYPTVLVHRLRTRQ
jgi:serine/threonine-protein kinase